MPRQKQRKAAIVHSPPKFPWPVRDSERIRWLLDFLRVDVNQMRRGALIDTRDDVRRCLHLADSPHDWIDGVGFPELPKQTGTLRDVANMAIVATDSAMPGFEDAVRSLLSNLQRQLRIGAETLSKGQPWAPFARGAAPRWQMVADPDDRTMARVYAGDWMTLSIAGAADLLLQWWPQLKACERCGVLFMPRHGHQRFHADCLNEARAERYKPKPKPKKRKRDYTAEERNAARRAVLRAMRERKAKSGMAR